MTNAFVLFLSKNTMAIPAGTQKQTKKFKLPLKNYLFSRKNIPKALLNTALLKGQANKFGRRKTK